MNTETHSQLANFIWSICNLLRGPYKRNEYRKVILPLTVLRRFDSLLAPTKQAVLKKHREIKSKPETVIRRLLEDITGQRFYNLSKMQFIKDGEHSLLDDPNNLAPNLNSYINAFSPNVRAIMERFTPREVIKLMVNLLLAPEKDLARSHVVKTIYDPACGTGGMLSVAEAYIRELNRDAHPKVFGQDWNDEAWAVCKSDMLIKGEDADNIVRDDTFTRDGFDRNAEGRKWTFDYMLANPPFGVEWKQQQRYIQQEADTLGYAGRFGAGTPRINDGALLFLQHMISKRRAPKDGGSRIGIVFNGSPLFTGDAGSGESNIRQWIIENDWLEAIVALPEQLFYNTGIATYVWIITNRKKPRRKGKVQLIDARNFWVQMEKSLGNKRRRIGDPSDKSKDPDHIAQITRIHANFTDGETRAFKLNGKEKELVVSKIFDNEDFGFHKITVERPLRLNFQATPERIARLEEQSAFKNLATSNKKNETVRQREIEAGKARQQEILDLLTAFAGEHVAGLFKDRKEFLAALHAMERARGVRLSATELKAVTAALGERNETAEICRDKQEKPEPDPDLRDTETVPLKEGIEDYFRREVLPHVPDAWIDHSKTKVGYEIPLNRHFYRYEPPRPLEVIEAEIKSLEGEILDLLREVSA